MDASTHLGCRVKTREQNITFFWLYNWEQHSQEKGKPSEISNVPAGWAIVCSFQVPFDLTKGFANLRALRSQIAKGSQRFRGLKTREKLT